MNTMSYGCELCHYKCPKASNLKTHFDTKKHKANEQAHKLAICRESTSKKTKEFFCETCVYRSNRLANFERHILSEKHTDLVARLKESNTPKESNETELLMNILRQNEELKTMLLEEHEKLQEEHQKLQEQRKEFQEHITMIMEERKEFQEHITMVMEERKELQEHITMVMEEHQKIQQHNAVLIEYCKEPRETKNNFNLNFFLNVQCKDAVNMTDFIRDLEIQVEDVENVGRLGFVEGISRIIMNGLKDLDLHKRPIHCTDIKRDVMYVRDENQWQKDENNMHIRKAIETVEQRNCKKLFNEMKPESTEMDESAEKYMRLVREINGGGARDKNHEKIIKNLSKNLTIDRTRSDE